VPNEIRTRSESGVKNMIIVKKQKETGIPKGTPVSLPKIVQMKKVVCWNFLI
jgi:hypothetical protein